MKTLKDVKVGETATVAKLHATNNQKKHNCIRSVTRTSICRYPSHPTKRCLAKND